MYNKYFIESTFIKFITTLHTACNFIFLNNTAHTFKIIIQLYDENLDELNQLSSTYFSINTFNRLLSEVGFENITWHQPIVDPLVYEKYPYLNWDEYKKDSQLEYFVAN